MGESAPVKQDIIVILAFVLLMEVLCPKFPFWGSFVELLKLWKV